MEINHKSLSSFFDEQLEDIECHQDTRAYIVSVFDKYKNIKDDLSDASITLLFSQARNKQDFITFQKIGDYVFFCNTLAPNHLRSASKDYYDTVARLSYNYCYKLINRQWKLYQEMADNFNYLEYQVKKKLDKIKL
jgi:hypothetical protein